MVAFALQVVDKFLLQYNLGEVLVVVFVLALLAALTQRSAKIIAIQTMAFGLIFMIIPSINAPGYFLYFGIGLLMISPMIFVTADR